jgi:hypothetical protein
MSEERQVHPQEPAEGNDEDVQEPGADRANGEEEVAEDVGPEEDVRVSGADRARVD